MTRLYVAALLAASVSLPVAAHATGGDGSRMPAGGNMMSSYVDHPSHDPRSVWSQQNRTGQILGQPMFSENAGAPSAGPRGTLRRNVISPTWSTGAAPSRRVR